ncbi:MAG: FAD-dependent oxidoreductase [Bacteroidales bacterium]|jgi:glycine/D-amino acid oxidase-like deaminating enzyme/Fe-S-cluster-containing hydrogenase component 2/thioredoxin reductase/bacterioferritin-associated ferredoxin/ferredoxin|nr:FAD-dependent oxidoreductase [Bacteroidales bacterium]MDI9591687.1 FAD-dependent oxidoreductase [Bacteroidota bacterium]HOR75517.1 FAD-dependent oxidoreductase [Bacteroidales bacterium]
MQKISTHPILEVPLREKTTFTFNGQEIEGEKGFTIAAALHQAGFPVHSHSLQDRNRSLECGIGKCGACEMLVDGRVKRICITKVDGIKEVTEIPKEYTPTIEYINETEPVKVYKTTVAIVGAGPAGLACREILNQHNIFNIVIDNNDKIGGQFLMQTHQFFFFEKEKKFGGMRGFDIANTLAGNNHTGIFLNSTVWDILEGKRLAVKNILTDDVYYVDSEYLVVATGAVPFLPAFKNDDLPGVFTAAVMQKMMNNEFTLLGKNILTVGAGNIGYLTSYQLMQAGGCVKAIIEAQPNEGGFPVQANRIRRLGIPIMTSKILLKAIPNKENTGITGAVIADCKNFNPIPGTEKLIDGIDAINICTGLESDDQLLIKGREIFGRNVYGSGDAIRIGEGTSAVLKGKQVAFEILDDLAEHFDYNEYLAISKEYIDSQQHPVRVIERAFDPTEERIWQKPFVIIDCLYGFACNPCEFSCPQGAIRKTSTSTVPTIDFEKCIGCMECVYQCPGLAIFGYNINKDWIFLPIEYDVDEGSDVFLVDNNGSVLGEGVLEKILKKPNKTNVARVKSKDIHGRDLLNVRGFIVKSNYPEPLNLQPFTNEIQTEQYICHCDDVRLDEILEVIGNRKFISVDEVKHTTRLGMGACRGKRCIKRLKLVLKSSGISIIGDPTPRAPLSNQVSLGDIYPKKVKEQIIIPLNSRKTSKIKVEALVAGGGIGGSALFRYLAEAGLKPVLANHGRGSSWRNIAGGRPNFSLPELSDIASQNFEIFKELQTISNIDFRTIDYVTFAHDNQLLSALEASMAWSDAYIIEPKDFVKHISPHFNPNLKTYKAAMVTKNCWQATPGKVVDLIRQIGLKHGGVICEDCEIIDIGKTGNTYTVLVRNHEKEYVEYQTTRFINAMGFQGDHFAKKIGIETGVYPVKHQAFITRRLPMMGINGIPLPMIIDRRQYKGFIAVYGQQLGETGQIIGCASPHIEPYETDKNLKINSKDFLEIVSEMFVDWIPELSSVGFQAVWAGYYVEPRMILDPENGLFLGLRGQGFMLGQYLAKMYVDKIIGNPVPTYFDRLTLKGDGLLEKAFK